MVTALRGVAVALCFSSLASPVLCLHEDQMGVADWSLRSVGAPQQAVFVGGNALVASKLGVVANVKSTTGALEWRHALSDAQTVPEFASGGFAFLGVAGDKSKKAVISVSKDGCSVRAWIPISGGILWDTNLCPAQAKKRSVVDVACLPVGLSNEGLSNVVVLSGNAVSVLNYRTGTVSGTWKPPQELRLEGLAQSSKEAGAEPRVFAFGREADGTLVVMEITQPLTASAGTASQVARTTGVEGPVIPVGSTESEERNFLAMVQSGEIMLLDLSDGALLSTLAVVEKGQSLSAVSAEKNFPMFRLGDSILAVAALNKKNAVPTVFAVAMKVEHAFVAKGSMVPGEKHGGMLVLVSSNAKSVQLHSFPSIKKGRATDVSDFEMPEEQAAAGLRGKAQRVFVQAAESLRSARVLVAFEDDSATLIQLSNDGDEDSKQSGNVAKVLFTREEALAEVTQVSSVELPPSSDSKASQATEKMAEQIAHAVTHGDLAFRLKDQVRLVRDTFLGISDTFSKFFELLVESKGQLLVQMYQGTASQQSGMSESSLIQFGFKRGLLMLTRGGKLFLLNSVDAKVMYQVFDPQLKGARMYVTRERTGGAQHPSELVLVSGRVLQVRNALTGALIKQQLLESPVVESLLVSAELVHQYEKRNVTEKSDGEGSARDEEAELAAGFIVALDEKSKWHVFPEDKKLWLETHGKALGGKIVLVHFDREAKTLSGLALEQGGAMPLWSLVVPKEDQVLAVASHAGGAVNNPGVIKGDGSVLVKYLNPNMMFVATRNSLGELVVVLLDAVSGYVLKRLSHRKANGPVHAVLFDNSAVYTYWSESGRRTELSVIQIFDGLIEKRDLNPWTPRGQDAVGSRVRFSSFDAVVEQPNVMQRTYFLDRAVRKLAVTTTRHGIADRRVLLASESGTITMLMRQFVDARRPLQPPTEAEKLEMLQQYFPSLPIISQHSLNYNLTLSRISGLYSFPTRLESTTLVVSTGLDIFFTRAQPSSGFDMLNEDFSYALLVVLILGLSVATVIMNQMVQAKQLATLWA